MFDWLLCYMLDKSYAKLDKNLKAGKDLFMARNESQVFYSKTLSIIFIERQIIERFIHRIEENNDLSLKPALDRILYLSALHFLEKHLLIFYEGQFFSSNSAVTLIRETILELCGQIKNDAVSLVDALAPPDYVLNSALGDSSGNAYKKLYNSMIQSPESMQPIPFLEEFAAKTKLGSLRSNL